MHSAATATTLLLLLAGLALAAVPDAARKPAPASDGTASTALGSKKLDTASKCTGAVAFSGAGLKGAGLKGAGLKGAAAPKDAPIALRTTLLDKGVGWKPEDGEFVCYCPGTYQFAFAGDAAAKLVLKKRAAGGSSWSPVVVGPQHVVILDMELGEAVAVFLEGGSQHADASATPAITFSGFRIAKKQ